MIAVGIGGESPASNVATAYTGACVIDLLVNGGFEDDLNGVSTLAPWRIRNRSQDRIICRPANAHSGECAFRFRGGTGENSRLIQRQNVEAYQLGAGDTLTLSLWVNAVNARRGGTVILTLIYTDGTMERVRLQLPRRSAGYVQLSQEIALQKPLAGVRLFVQYINPNGAGRIWIDDVSLTYTVDSHTISPAPDLIPMP